MSDLGIVGVGGAIPATVLSNAFLSELNSASDFHPWEESSGIIERRSVLPKDYIQATGNQDPRQALAATLQSPSELGAQAARQAMQRAGISVSEIGMIIAETCAPFQTCPGEAHRIGNALGVKIPAFDVVAGAASLIYYLDIVSKWDPKRVPRYILCVSTNTPSHSLCYSGPRHSGLACFRFGDAAAAFVLSHTNSGKLSLLDCFAVTDGRLPSALEIDTFGFVRLSQERYLSLVESHLRAAASEAINRAGYQASEIRFIGSPHDAQILSRVATDIGISAHHTWANLAALGDTLGAGVGTVLSDHWEKVTSGDIIIMATAGVGFSHGFATLRVN